MEWEFGGFLVLVNSFWNSEDLIIFVFREDLV